MHCIVMQKTFLIEKKLCCHKAQNHIIEKLSTTGNTFPPRKKGKTCQNSGNSSIGSMIKANNDVKHTLNSTSSSFNWKSIHNIIILSGKAVYVFIIICSSIPSNLW